MEFAEEVVRAAWDRQGGRCAKCGRWLVWTQRGRESMTGAWQPHHKDPADQEKRDTPANCIIFCSGVADCHFKEGHAGIDWSHHASLDDSRLLFLHAGEEETRRTAHPPPRKRRSLVRAFLGFSQVPAGEKRESQRRKPRQVPQEGAAPNTRRKRKPASGLGIASNR